MPAHTRKPRSTPSPVQLPELSSLSLLRSSHLSRASCAGTHPRSAIIALRRRPAVLQTVQGSAPVRRVRRRSPLQTPIRSGSREHSVSLHEGAAPYLHPAL